MNFCLKKKYTHSSVYSHRLSFQVHEDIFLCFLPDFYPFKFWSVIQAKLFFAWYTGQGSFFIRNWTDTTYYKTILFNWRVTHVLTKWLNGIGLVLDLVFTSIAISLYASIWTERSENYKGWRDGWSLYFWKTL